MQVFSELLRVAWELDRIYNTFEKLPEKQKEQRLKECKSNDERALLGSLAIGSKSLDVAKAGAEIIFAIADDSLDDASNNPLQNCLQQLFAKLKDRKCLAHQASSLLKALERICRLKGETDRWLKRGLHVSCAGENLMLAGRTGAFEAVVAAMRTHVGEADTCGYGIWVLWRLCPNGE